MKKVLVLFSILFILFVSGCSQSDNTELTADFPVHNDTTINSEEYSNETEIENDNNDFSNYDFNATDIKIIQGIFDSREKFEHISNNKTQEYTRKEVDVYFLNMFYDGNNIIFNSKYNINTDTNIVHVVDVFFKVSNKGHLTELPSYNFTLDTDSVQYVANTSYEPDYSDDEKMTYLAELYSSYKQKRIEFYGESSSDNDEEITLTKAQKKIADLVFNSRNKWNTYDNKNCVGVKIYATPDGKCEILCYCGKSYDGAYFDGYQLGYRLSKDEFTKLDDNEYEILCNDLSDISYLDWQNTWNKATQYKKLCDYIKTNVNI